MTTPATPNVSVGSTEDTSKGGLFVDTSSTNLATEAPESSSTATPAAPDIFTGSTDNAADGGLFTDVNVSGLADDNKIVEIITGAGLTGTNLTGPQTTLEIDSTVVTLIGTQTLTNKTLTSPAITSPVITGGFTGTGDSTLTGNLTIQGVNSGAGASPFINLFRVDAVPLAGDFLGSIQFSGTDSVGSFPAYASVFGRVISPTDGNEIGSIEFHMQYNGSFTQSYAFQSDRLLLLNDNDIQFFQHNNTGFDVTLQAATPSADRTITFPNATGTLSLTTATETLTNKTLTSPVLNTGISGSAFLDEDNMASDSATKVASQQSIKAYVDTQVATVPVGDITSVVAGTGLTGGGTSGDVTLNVIGGTGIDANADDIAIDSTVTTLTGSQTLTNKTLTSAVLNDTISGTSIKDEDNMASDSASHLASQQSIKAYVDSNVVTSIAADNITTGDAAVTIATSSGNITIDAQGSDTDIIFKGTDGASDITALTLDMSEAGKAVFNDKIEVPKIKLTSTTNASGSSTNHPFEIVAANGTGQSLRIDRNQISAYNSGSASNLFLNPDGGIIVIGSGGMVLGTDDTGINFGANSEIDLQHIHDIGLRITNGEANATLQFVDANESVSSDGTNLILTSGGTAFKIPTSDGSSGQALVTNGSGVLSFDTVSIAADNITAGDAAVNLTTTSGNITIDAQGSDTDIIFKGTDGTNDITALTLDMSAAGKAIFTGAISTQFWIHSTLDDGVVLFAGVNYDAQLHHVHNTGFKLHNSGAGSPAVELQFVDANEAIGSDGTNLLLTSGGTEFKVPTSDGSSGQALVTNASGVLSFASIPQGDVTLTGSQTLTNKTLTSPVLNTSISGSAFLDEDDMASNSATKVASQQSIKAYVDSNVVTSIAADNITVGDAAVNIATSSGNITIDAQGDDTDIIFKGTDGGVDTTALTLDMSEAGKAIFNSGLTTGGDYTAKTAAGPILNIQRSGTTVADDAILGQIVFQAPDVTYAAPNQGALAAFEIVAKATADFSSTNRSTKLDFKAVTGYEAGGLKDVFSINPDGSISLSSPISGAKKIRFHEYENPFDESFITLGTSTGRIRNSLSPLTDLTANIWYEADNHYFGVETGGGATPTYDGVLSLVQGKVRLPTGVVLEFEGATSNSYETTLTVTDPTADRTITLPNESGTLALNPAKKKFINQRNFISRNLGSNYNVIGSPVGYYNSQMSWGSTSTYAFPWIINGSDDDSTVTIDEVATRQGFSVTGPSSTWTMLVALFELNEYGVPSTKLYETNIDMPASIAVNTLTTKTGLTWSVKPGVYAMLATPSLSHYTMSNYHSTSGGSYHQDYFRQANFTARPALARSTNSSSGTGNMFSSTSPRSYNTPLDFKGLFTSNSITTGPILWWRYNTDL